MKKKVGKIIPNGVSLEKHENDIVVVFTELGYDVELIPLSYKTGMKTADAKIGGLEWEFKSPKGKGRWVLENTLQKAVRQSPNIVVDLRRIKISEERCFAQLKCQLKYHKAIKRLKVITKSGKVIDIK